MIPRIPGHLLVIVQFSGIALSIYPFNYSEHNSYLFLLFSGIGGILGLATLFYNRIGNFQVYPELKPGYKLITDGPYNYIRHPMYTSVILALLGTALYLNDPYNYLGLVMAVVAMTLKALKEEHLIAEEKPVYKEYMSRTTRFIPYIL
ncbi:MAG: isoprenylcysteine carboxylmethyltransferase family protein [Nitrospira sp.]|nr:isoprenylcysteine carboxylmethyltransferase family protein [Nitrospira sp.]